MNDDRFVVARLTQLMNTRKSKYQSKQMRDHSFHFEIFNTTIIELSRVTINNLQEYIHDSLDKRMLTLVKQ
jgi:hypothetical protein